MTLLIAFLLSITEAVYEGLRTAGHFMASEVIEAIYLFTVTWLIFAAITDRIPSLIKRSTWSLTKLLVAYVLLRFAVFDIAWDLAAGQSWDFYGSTKLYDRIMIQLGSWGWMLKAIAGFWAIAWLTNYRHQAES